MRVSHRSMAMISSGLQTSEISNFKTYLAPLDFIQSPGSGDAWLSADQWLRSFQVFGFQKSQTSNLLLTHFFLEHFIWSTQSVDACPPTDQWFPTTLAIWSFDVRALTCHITYCLSICRGTHRWFGVTHFSPRNSPDADT
jgi:hypothetical protein